MLLQKMLVLEKKVTLMETQLKEVSWNGYALQHYL